MYSPAPTSGNFSGTVKSDPVPVDRYSTLVGTVKMTPLEWKVFHSAVFSPEKTCMGSTLDITQGVSSCLEESSEVKSLEETCTPRRDYSSRVLIQMTLPERGLYR